MSFDFKGISKKLLILPPIIIGVAILAYQVTNRQGPQHETQQEVAKKVRMITVPKITLVPRVLGFGNVTPGKVWQAVSEVSGKIIEIHPSLKVGAILPKNTVILKIDPTDYELAIKATQADIRALDAQISELKSQEKNTKASITIEVRSLKLTEKDLTRKKDLLKRGAASQASVDQEERNLLTRRQSIQNLQNSLNLLPSSTERLVAQRAALEVKLRNGELDLLRATISLPFDARISEVNVEKDQFAGQGKTLITADSIDVSEVSAQLPVEKMAQLLDRSKLENFSATSVFADIENILGVKPIVRLRNANLVAEWPGRVVRVSDRLDPRTRSLGVIVAVDKPYELSSTEQRPPLAKNMYVEVELRGQPQEGQIVVPRSAIHNKRAYIIDKDNRLQIRQISVAYNQGDLAVISDGLEANEKIVVSDLIPAIQGMLLTPVEDAALTKSLLFAASGEGRL